METKNSKPKKPTSIVLGAARFDNVSTFPKSIAAVHVPDYPPLPDFLDRRKAKHQATEAAA